MGAGVGWVCVRGGEFCDLCDILRQALNLLALVVSKSALQQNRNNSIKLFNSTFSRFVSKFYEIVPCQ